MEEKELVEVPVRFERHRETIGGIEVVEAAFADCSLERILDLKKCKVGTDKTRFAYAVSCELFGPDSEESALWQDLLKEKRKATSKSYSRLWRFLKHASTPPT